MLFNLASAIKYLHSLNIVHRDIKPENLLVSLTLQCFCTDYEWSFTSFRFMYSPLSCPPCPLDDDDDDAAAAAHLFHDVLSISIKPSHR